MNIVNGIPKQEAAMFDKKAIKVNSPDDQVINMGDYAYRYNSETDDYTLAVGIDMTPRQKLLLRLMVGESSHADYIARLIAEDAERNGLGWDAPKKGADDEWQNA
jgi:hypothetical protein